MAVELQLLTASDFQLQMTKAFFIRFSDQIVGTAELEKVVTLPAYSTLERKPFSIMLQTTQKNHQYQQGIYTVEQASLGTMEIFLVPVGCNEKGLRYEAVFS